MQQHSDTLQRLTGEWQPGLWVFGTSFAALCLFYHKIAPHFPTTKQRSWILTTITSAVMTTSSLPFVWDYISNGGCVKSIRIGSVLAIPSTRFFQAHLFADCFMGALFYRDQFSMLTGWIHHIVYVLIVELAIRWSWTQIFCLCASMELPTFILSSTILYPRFRSNVLFAVSFFITRIMLHIILCISYLLPHNRAHTTDGSLLPFTVLSLIFPLHALWFHGCIQGFVKRANAKQASAPTLTPLAISPEKLTEMSSLTQRTPTDTCHSSMTVPGSFSLPPLRLRLSVQRLSPKHRRRSIREPLGTGTNLRTRSLERS